MLERSEDIRSLRQIAVTVSDHLVQVFQLQPQSSFYYPTRNRFPWENRSCISDLDTELDASCYPGADGALKGCWALASICGCIAHRSAVTDRCSWTTDAVGFPPAEVIRKAVNQRVLLNSDHFDWRNVGWFQSFDWSAACNSSRRFSLHAQHTVHTGSNFHNYYVAR